jgi:hypothetical protein
MADCPHCEYTTSSQGDEEPQNSLKEHLLSRHSNYLRQNKDSHEDIKQVAAAMAQKSTNRSHRQVVDNSASMSNVVG